MVTEGRIIGRKACPWCGFEAAHVRRNPGRNPYHYCPSCGYNVAARNGHQAELLTKGMRPEGVPQPDPGNGPPIPPRGPSDIIVADPPPPPKPKPDDTPPRKPAGWFDTLLTMRAAK